MTSKVTSATVSEVKFASVTENINSLTLDDIKKGFAGCSGEGIPMTSANFNAVLNWITENIGLESDMVVETIQDKKYLITKAKDGSNAKIEIVELIKWLRDSGVVTTNDFGNSFRFNEETNQYEIDAGVLISSESGNRLELRSSGLGVWDVVEPTLSKQYVDSVGGNDGNDGTKANPLKTFSEALRRLHDSKNGGRGEANIYLKNGGTYYIGRPRFGLMHSALSVTSYTDAHDGDEHIDSGVYFYHLAVDDKPKLVSQWLSYNYDTVGGQKSGMMTTCLYLKSLHLNGIEAILEKGEITFPAGTSHFALLGGELTLRGSIVDVRSYTFVRATIVNSGNTIHKYSNGGVLLDTFNDSYIYSDGDRSNYQETLNGTPYTIQGSNVRALPIENFGLAYDTPTKRQIGWSSNWDVFA